MKYLFLLSILFVLGGVNAITYYEPYLQNAYCYGIGSTGICELNYTPPFSYTSINAEALYGIYSVSEYYIDTVYKNNTVPQNCHDSSNMRFRLDSLTSTTQGISDMNCHTGSSFQNFGHISGFNGVSTPVVGSGLSASGVVDLLNSSNPSITNGAVYSIPGWYETNQTWKPTGEIGVGGFAWSAAIWYDFNLYWTYNQSINYTVRWENNNSLVTDTITYNLYNDDWQTNGTTNSSQVYISEIPAGTYTLRINDRYYNVFIEDFISSDINDFDTINGTAYLLSSPNNVTFNVRDDNAQLKVIENALISIAYQNGTEWITVEERRSDVSGIAIAKVDTGKRYRFIVNAEGYQTRTFYLDPVEFNEYNIYLNPLTGTGGAEAFISYNPKQLQSNTTNTVSATFQAYQEELISYTLLVETPYGSNTTSGVNPQGGTIQTLVTIPATNNIEYANITMNYTTSTGTYTNKVTIPIFTDSVLNTWDSLEDTFFGMSTFERVVVASVMIVIMSSVGFIYGGVLVGGFISLLMIGFFVSIGFFNLLIILPSAIIGIILLVWSSAK